MFKRVVIFFVCSIFLISLGGCATGRKDKDLEIQGLKNQISVLQAEIEAKDQEIGGLRDTLTSTVEQKESLVKATGKKKVSQETKSRPTIKQIQVALTNAGYNPGSVDGRMGKQTREAIRAFQKANNLSPDGKMGNKTWDLLKGYLDKKVK
ncbi:MAG: peptidoglycan-binding domain-containing protein [Candidatus Omnitrophica bacterium]|nr:peptidoglycan-binding domain-containing protein [Candidatus Omnitrophota bacterium]MDD5591819.1 peptidoglycan-binding domain-containing protein [Candidatus Omnitrophota bacterium]